ncbi:MAG: hypothetical protein AAB355_01005 [Patescibacteria group bacterium]
MTRNFNYAIKEKGQQVDFWQTTLKGEAMQITFEVTPQAIIWLVGKRNVKKIDNNEYHITSHEGLSLQRKATGEEVEIVNFSDGRHPKNPESVKVRQLMFFSKWIPMHEFTFPPGETPQEVLKDAKDGLGADDGPIAKIANVARFVL